MHNVVVKVNESWHYAFNPTAHHRLPRTESRLSGQKNKDVLEYFQQNE